MSGTICRIKNRYSKEYDLIKEAYKDSNLVEGTYLDGMVSRKKQMYPQLAAVI